MAWLTVGMSMQDDQREKPNAWVTLRCVDLINLTPRQARELAAILQSAADNVEKFKDGVLVEAAEFMGKKDT